MTSYRSMLMRQPPAPAVKIPIYANHADRDALRAAGRFNAELMDFLRPKVQPGVTTGQLDQWAYDYTIQHGHTPACFGYNGFPKSICTSVNEVICHGIPGNYELKDGDIVNIDATTIVNGWHGDSSETVLVGEVSFEARRLVQAAFDSLWLGIHAIKPFGRVIDIGRAIFRCARDQNFEVVREFQGHGIGRSFHQEPGIPHFPDQRSGKVVIRPGMCFTIEPMINAGSNKSVIDTTDGWTVRTQDGQWSAQFEHTILMTEKGPEVLTLTKHGPQEGHQF